MPSWCNTCYKIKGDSKEIHNFYNLLNALDFNGESITSNSFGNLWLGNVIYKLKGDYTKIYCMGEIIEYHYYGDMIILTIESAWSEPREWRLFIESKYPSFKIYYKSEENEFCYYLTNDRTGIFFPERYLLDSDILGQKYFRTIEDACKFIEKLCNVKVTTMEEIDEVIEAYSKEYNCYLFFVEFAVVDY